MTRFSLALLALVALPSYAGPAGAPAYETESAQWSRTIERVRGSIVTIRLDQTRAFDTEWNSSGQATGFIVDAERGLILTNRHVVTPGPVIAEAIFQNKEEVALKPVYRDPVHDFGIYQYDPKQLRFNTPRALQLAPERATIGREIRVIGNDAGEQLSILAGTLARLDREAPDYGRGNYNDFNTFYIQAASSTSGGSSGSPVIDIDGKVVALNAGARQGAASSFYLPLDRPGRALDLIRKGEKVTRGTLQTVFMYQPYDELHRLGLRPETESAMRKAFPDGTGLLVVDQVVPGGSASMELEVGDVLTHLDGKPIASFVPLDAVLDDKATGRPGVRVKLDIERGGKPMSFDLDVRDLHNITPSHYLEFGGAVLHDLSYQMARHLNRAPRGVFVANPGYALATAAVPRGALIYAIDGVPVRNTRALADELSSFAEGQRFTLRYATFDQPNRAVLASITMDRKWNVARFCERDDATGLWPCRELTSQAVAPDLTPAEVRIPQYEDKRQAALASSLVFVNFDMPYQIDGVDGSHYYGTGLVVDAARGLVVVDRNTVPVALGDVRVTFAGSVEVPGRVVYIHPLHNLAVVSYDPALITGGQVKSAQLATKPLAEGDETWVIGFRGDQSLTVQGTKVKSFDPLVFPLSNTFRFRDSNLKVVNLAAGPADVDGVVADAKGRVVALWSSFAYQQGRGTAQTNLGIPVEFVREVIALVDGNGGLPLRSLEIEFIEMPLASARKLGLDEEWAARIGQLDDQRRRVLSVERLVAGSPASKSLREGDLLLAVDGVAVNSFRAVELASQKESVTLTVIRDGNLFDYDIETVALTGRETDRVVQWAGALLQVPHRAVAAQRGIERTGVFVAYFSYGSPASRYGVSPGRRILAVDDEETKDLDAFLKVVASKKDRDAVRLKTSHPNGKTEVLTLKLDLAYWPTLEFTRSADGSTWTRTAH
jgi:S1-C subfamily serine protease